MAPETELFCHLCQKTFDKKEAISAHVCVEIKQETQDSKVQDHEDLNINSSNFQPPPLHLIENYTGLVLPKQNFKPKFKKGLSLNTKKFEFNALLRLINFKSIQSKKS